MCLMPKRFYNSVFGDYVSVPCGSCLECAVQYSDDWALRISLESSLYSLNCFLTLTYDNEHFPSDGSVSRSEISAFIKRLRSALSPLRIRFFACGEYGKRKLRPHYHIIIFNWFPDDAYHWTFDGKVELFRSPFLERIWKKGYSSVGYVTYSTAKYCAKYLNKFAFTGRVRGLNPPFVQMSNRPGIGAVFAFSSDFDTGYFYFQGKRRRIPRYFVKILSRVDPLKANSYRALSFSRGEFYNSLPPTERKSYLKKFLPNS